MENNAAELKTHLNNFLYKSEQMKLKWSWQKILAFQISIKITCLCNFFINVESQKICEIT